MQQQDKLVVYHDYASVAEYPPLALIGWPLTLSGDGTRLAWRVGKTIYLDGVAQPITGEVGNPVLSHDGRTLAYTCDGAVVVNGRRGPQFEQVYGVVMSDDGSVVAYRAEDEEGKTWVVAGERRIDVPGGTGSVAISPDGRTLAWEAEGRVWVEGRPGPPLRPTGRIVLSPDGRDIAYPAMKDGRSILVLNERLVDLDGLIEQVHFSPDGRHLGCVVTVDRKQILWKTIQVR